MSARHGFQEAQMLNYFCLMLVIIFSGLSADAFAATIVLKSGQTLEAEIVERTDKYVKVDSDIGVAVTYYFDEVETVDGERVGAPLQTDRSLYHEERGPKQQTSIGDIFKEADPGSTPGINGLTDGEQGTSGSSQLTESDNRLELDRKDEKPATEEPLLPLIDGIAYHDDKIGITFTLPPKWTVKPVSLAAQEYLYIHPESLVQTGSINGIIITRYKELTDIPDGAPPYFNIKVIKYDLQGIKGFLLQGVERVMFKGSPASKLNLIVNGVKGEALYFYKGGYEFTILYLLNNHEVTGRVLDSISFDPLMVSPPKKDKYMPSRLEKVHLLLTIGGLGGVYFLFYALFSFFVYFVIAKKMNIGQAWLAFIPVANNFLACKMVGISGVWLSVFLFPLLLMFVIPPPVPFILLCVLWFIFHLVTWFRMITALGRPGWLVLPVSLPVLQFFALGSLILPPGGSRLGWKIYFWFMFVVGYLLGYPLLFKEEGFSWIYIVDLMITTISIPGLYCFVFEKRWLKAIFWKSYFVLIIIWDVLLNFFIEPNMKADYSLIDTSFGLVIAIPLYVGIYCYAFKVLSKPADQ
jgi:hypothetical protein